MKKTLVALSILSMSAVAAFSADDPIAARKALMHANAGAAGLSAGMMKGEIDYSPAAGKAAISTFNGVAMAYGDFFPEDSMEGDTKAAPAIWENPDEWQAALDKFKSDASAAMQASGREGPADAEAFQAAVGPVLQNCRSCHEDFQLD